MKKIILAFLLFSALAWGQEATGSTDTSNEIIAYLNAERFNNSSSRLTLSDPIEFVNSAKILKDGKKLTSQEVKDILEVNPDALALYKKGKSNRTIGSILLIGGAVVLVGQGISNLSQDAEVSCSGSPLQCTDDSGGSPAGIIIGGISMLGSIPFLISGKSKIRESVNKYNDSLGAAVEPSGQGLYLATTQNGVGVVLRF